MTNEQWIVEGAEESAVDKFELMSKNMLAGIEKKNTRGRTTCFSSEIWTHALLPTKHHRYCSIGTLGQRVPELKTETETTTFRLQWRIFEAQRTDLLRFNFKLLDSNSDSNTWSDF